MGRSCGLHDRWMRLRLAQKVHPAVKRKIVVRTRGVDWGRYLEVIGFGSAILEMEGQK